MNISPNQTFFESVFHEKEEENKNELEEKLNSEYNNDNYINFNILSIEDESYESQIDFTVHAPLLNISLEELMKHMDEIFDISEIFLEENEAFLFLCNENLEKEFGFYGEQNNSLFGGWSVEPNGRSEEECENFLVNPTI